MNEHKAIEIKRERRRSFRNIRDAARALQNLPHDPHGTPKVRAASESCVRRIAHDARATLPEIASWSDERVV